MAIEPRQQLAHYRLIEKIAAGDAYSYGVYPLHARVFQRTPRSLAAKNER